MVQTDHIHLYPMANNVDRTVIVIREDLCRIGHIRPNAYRIIRPWAPRIPPVNRCRQLLLPVRLLRNVRQTSTVMITMSAPMIFVPVEYAHILQLQKIRPAVRITARTKRRVSVNRESALRGSRF